MGLADLHEVEMNQLSHTGYRGSVSSGSTTIHVNSVLCGCISLLALSHLMTSINSIIFYRYTYVIYMYFNRLHVFCWKLCQHNKSWSSHTPTHTTQSMYLSTYHCRWLCDILVKYNWARKKEIDASAHTHLYNEKH